MNRHEAHRLLDMVRGGYDASDYSINLALTVTGDLGPSVSGVDRPQVRHPAGAPDHAGGAWQLMRPALGLDASEVRSAVASPQGSVVMATPTDQSGEGSCC